MYVDSMTSESIFYAVNFNLTYRAINILNKHCMIAF